MSLIICPECGEKISDTTEQCVHCGFLIKSQQYKIFYKNVEYDLSPIIPAILNNEPIFNIWQWTSANCNIVHFPSIELLIKDVQNGNQLKHSMEEYEQEVYLKAQEKNCQLNTTKSLPKCPTCGSTNIRKISNLSRSSSFLVHGLASSKMGKTMECLNPKCGYKW